IIMITHDPSLAKEANRIITIQDGKIISDEENKK
ncbi:MAG: ABC transporter ATP-binding protein, partial [Bacilli bacterium]|nr:ABC transporter ATP-binding protein [Bacilli bacterium]